MDVSLISPLGTGGWILLIGFSTIRSCSKGHWSYAIFSFVIFTILAIDLWAILPQQILSQFPGNTKIAGLLWTLVGLPYGLSLVFGAYTLYQMFKETPEDP